MEKNASKNVHGVSDLGAVQFGAWIREVQKHLDAIDALYADAKGLDPAQRKTASHLNGPDEVTALDGVLRFAAVHGELFTGLADEDEGVDPARFETALLESRLQNAQTLALLADRFAALQAKSSDCALYTTQLVKPVVLKAYALAKGFANRISHGELLFPAKSYYRTSAVTAARNRAARKNAPAPVTPPAGSTPTS